jgi:hypothetical protein
MSTLDEQIAAATLAKIFGSELKKIDDNTIQRPSSGQAARLDPASFLTVVREIKQQQQQQDAQQANMLAEQLYPLPAPMPAPIPFEQPNQRDRAAVETVASSELIDVLKSIDSSLSKITNIIETKWQSVF